MIRSMTGFGRASFEVEGVGFELEIRTVNSRHLDVRIKLPRSINANDLELKSAVQARMQRGKVDLSVSLAGGGPASKLELDLEAAGQYLEAAAKLREECGLEGGLEIEAILGLPGVTRVSELQFPAEDFQAALLEAANVAVSATDAMRAREGETLMKDLSGRLVRVIELVDSFEARSGLVVEAARQRLRKRSKQLEQDTGILDEGRLHQEIVIAADRMDISEELVRLRSHVDQFHRILDEGSAEVPVGRRLDFLLQELGREANTVGSKVADAPLAHDVVELKTELERIREQVQNLE
jgi:uncharacterized protein (TIGR00255 family)